MTSDEISETAATRIRGAAPITIATVYIALMEIAAQLAEINETLRSPAVVHNCDVKISGASSC